MSLNISEQPADVGFAPALLFGALGLSLLACTALLWKTGLRVDLLRPGNLPYFAALALLFAVKPVLATRQHRWAKPGAEFAQYVGFFMALSLIGAVTTYPLAALSHGFADAWLQRIDETLHFDWLAWYEAAARHRSLQLLGIAAYQSIYVIPAAILATYALRGQRRDAHRFLAAFWLSAILTLSLYIFMPAVGPLSYLWKGTIPYMPSSAIWQETIIPPLRAHQFTLINLNELRGLVSAPSFHTASGVLYIAMAWRTGNLRWPLIGLSVAMLFSVPVEGTHYFSDMIIGALVALVGLIGASKLIARFGTTRPLA
ncbi:phosphatase PAP2 family protein [Sphingomonas sp. R-74633]|uniref:phosphatase PAP2 family protein n=1 Tax=Sphingomonas sp. R-74633 TaxID=2751188 RepID=UPI0015D30121|nr:phosphatase PAP2 family protein [Sphingomonas sp. R-74633]NYT39858.1 phosphatase PAP2 family protein [Sphingomonas sp. R-74633]